MLDVAVKGEPDREGFGEQSSAGWGESQDTGAAVVWVGSYGEQAAALKRLQRGGEGGSIDGEQRGDSGHRDGAGPVQRHEQRELAVSEAERAEGVVEAAGEDAGGSLEVEAEAVVANVDGVGVGDGRWAVA